MRTIFTVAVLGMFLAVSACGPSEQEKQAQAAQLAAQQAAEQAKQAQAAELAKQQAEQERIAQQQAAYKTAIETVLKANAGLSSTSGQSQTAHAQAMRAIDLTACPTDFAAAYTTHIQAWERAGNIQKSLGELKSDANVTRTVAESILGDITGSKQKPIGQAVALNKRLTVQHAEANTQITETFNEVERIAVTYGATVPH